MTPIDLLHARLDRMEEKLDKLLQFKWQIIGGSVVLSLILTVGFQVALTLIQSKGG